MKRGYLRATLVLAIAAAAPRPAAGQVVPGAPATDWERERTEYTVDVLNAYNAMMGEWRSAWERRDASAAAEFYMDDAFLFVPETDVIQGRDSIRSYLATALPGVVEIRTGLTDFVASDRLAYALGPFWYQVRVEGAGTRTHTGTFVTVLVREGRRWLIRSQVFKYAGDSTGSGS